MRLIRRICATALVASVALLAACGESGTTTPTNDAELALGTREFAITPSHPTWTKQPADPLPTDARTVLISGLVAVASYPQFGTPVYTGANNWLDMNLAPNFQRTPLGWVVTFRLKPGAAALPIGRYTATIPVNVPAAVNNPQMITVVYSNCDNCLFVGDERDAELTAGDPRWDWDSDYNEAGQYPYDDWRVFVPAFTDVFVTILGEDCTPGYTHEDNTLTAWTTPDLNYVDGDDDGACSNDPIIFISNNTGSQREYLVRASSYDEAFDGSRDFGTYRIIVGLNNNTIREKGPAEAGDKPNLLTTKF